MKRNNFVTKIRSLSKIKIWNFT